MPGLDVTDLLADPDFFTTFDVIRRRVSPGAHGVPTEADQTFKSVSGVVVPTSARELMILPEGSYQQGTISIFTTFRLEAGKGRNYRADLVVWRGANYAILVVSDYGEFGQGFYEATGQLAQVNP